ncbi:MAG: DUF2794 domain-containing protein [Hyphomonadaceae bacterium]|nr:DUF2794 domain-containing protein [Hyphomonadaceae bacterium]MBC6412594.1 DUF2794 domain-containing protein [Hyphomonadaceae bacterium]
MTSNVVSLHRSRQTVKQTINLSSRPPLQIAFDRRELGLILDVYGFMVSKGHWKDYAVDFLTDRAVFSAFRRAAEYPLYRIEKRPALKNCQGQYSVIAPGGLILKHGNDLKSTLRVFDRKKFQSTTRPAARRARTD